MKEQSIPGKAVVMWWILIAALVSLFGARLTFVGTGLWLFKTTDSTSQLALIAGCALLPGLILQPRAGRLIDKTSARLIWGLGIACSLGFSLIFWWLLHSGSFSYAALMVLAMGSSAASAVHQPFVMKVAKISISESDYLRFNAARTMGFSLVELCVPLLAAWMIEEYSLHYLVAIDCLALLVCLVMMGVGWRWLPHLPLPQSSVATACEGFNVSHPTKLRPWIWRIVALNWLAGALMITLMPIALVRLSTIGYGACMTLAGVGGLIGAFLCSRWSSRSVDARFSDIGLLLISIGVIATSLSINPMVFLSLAMVVGGLYAATLCLIHTGCLTKVDASLAGEAMGGIFLWAGIATLVSVGVNGIVVDMIALFANRSSAIASAWLLLLNAIVLLVVSLFLANQSLRDTPLKQTYSA